MKAYELSGADDNADNRCNAACASAIRLPVNLMVVYALDYDEIG